jgi:hypothetical protein
MARRKSTSASVTQAKAQTLATAEVVSVEPVTLTGRLTADPVLRKTKSGLSVSTIRIAVNPPEGDATFHDVVTWKRTAEVVCQCLKKGRKIIAVSDNLSTRGTQEVTEWLANHPRWSFQFTPTHASWLNQVEIFFSILYRRLLKHGSFFSEEDLAEQMLAFIETYNQTAKPFKWTYTGKVLEA